MPKHNAKAATAKRKRAIIAGGRVYLRPPRTSDQKEFLQRMRDSRELHAPWVKSLDTPGRFSRFLTRSREQSRVITLVCRCEDDAIVGVMNINDIVRGNFKGGNVGYYAFSPFDGRGYMTEALRLMIRYAFATLRLHRLEAGVQPGNERSIALVRRLGFRNEGLARRLIRIRGRWRDHYRFAMLVEDWRARRRQG